MLAMTCLKWFWYFHLETQSYILRDTDFYKDSRYYVGECTEGKVFEM